MVDTLVPGISTLSRLARYYSLYWALADFAECNDLDAAACKQLVRRSEVAIGWASIWDPVSGTYDGAGDLHGADSIRSLVARGSTDVMDREGVGSYSTRPWGFWSQYAGPCVTLGAVAVEKRALRSGEVACPQSVKAMFKPLFEICAQRPVDADDLAGLQSLTVLDSDSPDMNPLIDLLTSSRRAESRMSGNNETRRAAFRILGRCAQLENEASFESWTALLRSGVAYGAHIESDPVLASEQRAPAWRGTLLRHQFVGAWRAFWADLVDEVGTTDSGATRPQLHSWVEAGLPVTTVHQFLATLQDTRDVQGHPRPAESDAADHLTDVSLQIATLLIGAQRDSELSGISLNAFRGGRSQAKQFLDPQWVGFRRDEYLDRPLAEFACVLVDDMLAQSQRVSMRKMRMDSNGYLTMPTKLHQREGVYFASGTEGSGNIGLRTEQIGGIAEQLGLVSTSTGNPPEVTDLGVDVLDLHQ
uniref:hypothetical protein n=1 Tax=Gordonia sp. B7-2 TaxID=3420932 RepID=UPI003D91946C